jgi:hypothetical protein
MLFCAMARKLIKPPCLVASDGHGQVFEIPELQATGRRLRTLLQPEPGEYLPMPNGSSLFELPGRKPVGFDPVTKKLITVEAYRGVPVNAVAAFLAPAYTQMWHAAFVTDPAPSACPCSPIPRWDGGGISFMSLLFESMRTCARIPSSSING